MQYILQIIYDIFEIPMVYQEEDKIFQFPKSETFRHPIVADEMLWNEMHKVCKENSMPVVYMEDERIFYGIFRFGSNSFFCIGPASIYAVELADTEEYRKRHCVQTLPHLKQINYGVITKLLAMVYFQFTGKCLKYSDVLAKSSDSYIEDWVSDQQIENYLLSQSENDRHHGKGIAFENKILEIVRTGDIEAMKEIMSDSPDISGITEVSSDNYKQTEYMVVAMLTLMTRAAIEGGMNSEAAYNFGDVYLGQLAKCRHDTGALKVLGLKAEFDFVQKVHKARQRKSNSLSIEKCKDYIAKNLRKDIKVSDIAPAIGISRTYLSHKFSEIEGMTIQQYIIKERCEHAANLLKYSDYPISLISGYFCFTSQSHFGSWFKRIFGMTPKEYRLKYNHIQNDL